MDDFGWRVSMAEVALSGPFSRFDSVDRILTVLEGRLALAFAEEGRVVMLDPGSPFAFPGDVAVSGAPMGGRVRDLNVMVRRGLWRAQVEIWRPDLAADGVRMAIATAPSPTIAIDDALLLDPGDRPPDDFIGYLIRIDPVA
jgi:environmental stress-induced protein Ves